MTEKPKKDSNSFLQNIFVNDSVRLRSGWRFTIFIVIFLFLFDLLTITAGFILKNLPIGFDPNSLLASILTSGIGLFLAILLGWLLGRFIEDLPFRALGAWFTKNWFKDLVLGLLIGGGSLAFAVLIAVVFGNYSFEVNNSAGSSAIILTLGASFIVFIFGAAFEEALVRGYIFQTLTRANLAWLAILLTSLFFAAGHLGNPSSNYFSSINTALAGVWLGIAYLKTRTLWLAFGIHFAWNWVQGAIFGIEVSGLTDITTAPLLKEIDVGSKLFSGGDYGIEAGVACTIALIISTVLIWYLPILKPTEEMLALTSEEIPNKNFFTKTNFKQDEQDIQDVS